MSIIIKVQDNIKTTKVMTKTFLEYFKTLIPNFSFDKSLMLKEYQKALKLLNPNEQINLTNWLTQKGLSLQPIKI